MRVTPFKDDPSNSCVVEVVESHEGDMQLWLYNSWTCTHSTELPVIPLTISDPCGAVRLSVCASP